MEKRTKKLKKLSASPEGHCHNNYHDTDWRDDVELTLNQSQVLECIKRGMHNHEDIRNQTDIRLDRVYEAIRSLKNKKVITKKMESTVSMKS